MTAERTPLREKLWLLLSLWRIQTIRSMALEIVLIHGLMNDTHSPTVITFDNGKIYILLQTATRELSVYKIIPGGNAVMVLSGDYLRRGWWLFDLWRAL